MGLQVVNFAGSCIHARHPSETCALTRYLPGRLTGEGWNRETTVQSNYRGRKGDPAFGLRKYGE